jgi:hypothetical protein
LLPEESLQTDKSEVLHSALPEKIWDTRAAIGIPHMRHPVSIAEQMDLRIFTGSQPSALNAGYRREPTPMIEGDEARDTYVRRDSEAQRAVADGGASVYRQRKSLR